MLSLTKKQRERKILDLVFKQYPNLTVKDKDTERPDFWLRFINEEKYFGVEVTERYDSESSARLINIPNYASELIEGKTPRHKADEKTLNVGTFEVLDPENKPKTKINAVSRVNPSEAEFIKSVQEIIIKKDKKRINYSKTLDHINLIIYNYENSLHQYSTADFIRFFFKPETKSIVLNSDFREIFFLTRFEDSIIHSMPLKLQLFYNETFMFSQFLFEYNSKVVSESFTDLHVFSLLVYLKLQGFRDVKCRLHKNDLEIFYSGYGLILKNPMYAFGIRFYTGTNLPNDLMDSDEIIRDIKFDNYFQHVLNMRKDKFFIYETIEQITPHPKTIE